MALHCRRAHELQTFKHDPFLAHSVFVNLYLYLISCGRSSIFRA